MTMAAAEMNAPTAPHPRLRVALIVIAAIATLSALADFSAILYDHGHTKPLVIFAQWPTKMKLAIAPFAAGAALAFAIAGRLPHAIIALATLTLVTWVSELPSLAIHGLEVSASFPGALIFAQLFVYPVVAVAAVMFALRNERLALATASVSLPTILVWLGVLAFGIGVAIYGF